jgi:tetratricopeptide (TPR) repeat protein
MAEEALNKFPGDRWSNASYLSTRANVLRHRKDFGEAEKCLRRAIKLEPDNPVHYGGMAQLHLDRAAEAAPRGERQHVLLHIDEARTFLQKGLSKSEDSEALMSIKHAIDRLESNIGLR